MAYTVSTSTKLECHLCPHECRLNEGQFGLCSIRKNEKMNLKLPYKGFLSAINIDPIEKKPLYHFFPGSKILSVGFLGCNFHCQFCQNYKISQNPVLDRKKPAISPIDLVNTAEEQGLGSIAYTYSEPVIHFEYILECAEIAHSRGIKNVLVTNGFLNLLPAGELLSLMDGVNIDLKSFTQSFYNNLGGEIEPVKEFIKLASELTHIEITTLVIPGQNDSVKEIMDITNFIASLSTSIPLHLSCYYPSYNYDLASTPVETVLHLADKAAKVLKYVYPGNIGSKEINTYCNNCGNILVKRKNYSVTSPGIIDKHCINCNSLITFPN